MDRRRCARVSVQLPVSVWGVDIFGQAFSMPAMVTNLSVRGLVLQGLRRRMRVGDALDIRMGSNRCQFRVIWTGDTLELGLECVAGSCFLPALELAAFSQPAASC